MKKILFIMMFLPALLLCESVFPDNTKSKNIIPIKAETASTKSYIRPAIESASFIAGLWGYNYFIAKEKWAIIGFNTIEANFRHGPEWDSGQFGINQIYHPYEGAIFFTIARSNSLSFTESAAYTFGGSLVWEFFMENHYPSINDMITTTFGGIALGEVLYRLSNLCLDEGATGGEKIIRETFSRSIFPNEQS